MTKQEFIAKYDGWFSYSKKEDLKKQMEADLEAVFTALRQPPISSFVALAKSNYKSKDGTIKKGLLIDGKWYAPSDDR